MAVSLGIQSVSTHGSGTNDQGLESIEIVTSVTERADSDGDASNAPADLAGLVMRIERSDESGMQEFYQLFARGVRFYLCRQLGLQDVDDKVHDIFLIVVHAIQRGDLREPERLMGFVRTVVRRQVAAHIDRRVHCRKDEVHADIGLRVPDHRLNPDMVCLQSLNHFATLLQHPPALARGSSKSRCWRRAAVCWVRSIRIRLGAMINLAGTLFKQEERSAFWQFNIDRPDLNWFDAFAEVVNLDKNYQTHSCGWLGCTVFGVGAAFPAVPSEQGMHKGTPSQ